MNHKCHGQYFITKRASYWRCLLDGSIVRLCEEDQQPDMLTACPACQRPITQPVEPITAKIRTIKAQYIEYTVDGQGMSFKMKKART